MFEPNLSNYVLLELLPTAIGAFIALWGLEGLIYLTHSKLTNKMTALSYVVILATLIFNQPLLKYAVGCGVIGILLAYVIKKHRLRKGPIEEYHDNVH